MEKSKKGKGFVIDYPFDLAQDWFTIYYFSFYPQYNLSTPCFLCVFFETVNCNLFICNIL